MRKMMTNLAALSLIFTGSMALAQDYEQQQDEAYASEESEMALPADEMNLDQVQPEAVRRPPFRPHPRPRVRWVRVACGASPFQYKECRVDGRILQASLIQTRSIFPCKANQSWGAKRNAIWTRFGCNGVFRVQVQENNGRDGRDGRDDGRGDRDGRH